MWDLVSLLQSHNISTYIDIQQNSFIQIKTQLKSHCKQSLVSGLLMGVSWRVFETVIIKGSSERARNPLRSSRAMQRQEAEADVVLTRSRRVRTIRGTRTLFRVWLGSRERREVTPSRSYQTLSSCSTPPLKMLRGK